MPRVTNPCAVPSRMSPAARTRLESVSTPRPARPTAAARPRTGRIQRYATGRDPARSSRPGSPVDSSLIPRRASAPSQGHRPRWSVSSLVLGAAGIQQPLDDHAITPAAIQFPMTAMDSDFFETEPLQKGAACNILRKYPAGELVQAGGGSRLDQRGENRAAGAAAAKIPPYIDREF